MINIIKKEIDVEESLRKKYMNLFKIWSYKLYNIIEKVTKSV